MDEYDYELVYGVGQVISNIVGLALGFLAVFLVVYVTFTTASDVFFLASPTFQELIIRKYDNKKLGGFKIVSDDARLALEESMRTGELSSILYFKKRLKTYIVVAMLLTIIITSGQAMRDIVLDFVIKLLEAVGLGEYIR